MIQPAVSPVAPRVHSRCTGDVIPLSDEISQLLTVGRSVSVRLDGEGKTTALGHLASVFADQVSDGRLQLQDKTIPLGDGDPIVTVFTAQESQADIVFRLATWGQDDFIEYLLAKHPDQCASVMGRLASANTGFANGSPAIWQLVLDRMAADSQKSDVEEIVLSEIHLRINDPAVAGAVADRLLFSDETDNVGLLGHTASVKEGDASVLINRLHPSVQRFLGDSNIRVAFVVQRFVERLHAGSPQEIRCLMSHAMAVANLKKISTKIGDNSAILEKLDLVFEKGKTPSMSNCATLLSMCDPLWRPRGERLDLFRCHFFGVNWPDINLSRADLRRTCFVDANLAGARFAGAKISVADFAHANLRRADFSTRQDDNTIASSPQKSQPARNQPLRNKLSDGSQVVLPGFDEPSGSEDPTETSETRPKQSTGKRLTPREKARNRKRKKQERKAKQRQKREAVNPAKPAVELAKMLDYSRVSFVKADLSQANVSGCRFNATDFSGANLSGLKASGVHFENVRMIDADLSDANFFNAQFQSVQLRGANISRCKFEKLYAAFLSMENMTAADVDFLDATIPNSDWTGSTMTQCRFQSAEMVGAKMAGINWENCDMRSADMRGVTFHLGTTRSGLVNSPYPSHGTRTGFYTDEFEERYFKSPESIRVASMRGCDLRGANIHHVDFYLVDLRGARYDSSQREQLVSTGAILDGH